MSGLVRSRAAASATTREGDGDDRFIVGLVTELERLSRAHGIDGCAHHLRLALLALAEIERRRRRGDKGKRASGGGSRVSNGD
jgi:hypothetical protein